MNGVIQRNQERVRTTKKLVVKPTKLVRKAGNVRNHARCKMFMILTLKPVNILGNTFVLNKYTECDLV